MAMSEMKQKLLLYELAQAGFPDAEYIPEFKRLDGITMPDKIMIKSDNLSMLEINNAGDILFARKYANLAINIIRPLADKVNEAVAAWEKAIAMPFEGVSQFRIFAEYNNTILAARDDTKYERGLYFVTWEYTRDRTGVAYGHYTEDYNAAKEDFARRSGLMSGLKMFTPEQAEEIISTIEYCIENDNDFYLTIPQEESLKSIAETLRDAYSLKQNALADEPLMGGIEAPDDASPRRYMDIDLALYLGKIAEKVIIHYPADWEIDKKMLHKAAVSDNPEDKRLMWHVCSYGTHMNTERDTFIKDTGAFNSWVDYRKKDEDMFGYVIEVTGRDGGIIKGNVFEVGDYYTHSLYVCDTALGIKSIW